MKKLNVEEIKKELLNEEMSFTDLDNFMMESGYYSVFDDGVTADIKQDGNVVYTATDSNECEVQIFFEITIDNGEDEAEEAKKQCIDGTSIRSLTTKISKANKSGIKGVHWDKKRNKWAAQITFKGKNHYLGRYDNKEDAREAREKAEKEMFGKFLEEHKEYVKDKKDKKTES